MVNTILTCDWLPFSPQPGSSRLVHDMTGEVLLSNHTSSFYTFWYGGPDNATKTRYRKRHT